MERLKRRLSSQSLPGEMKKSKATVPTYSYDLFMRALSNLSDHQKTVLHDIGFSSLLYLSCSEVPSDLFHWLVDHFDPESRTLNLENGFKFTLNSKVVQKILGIPAGVIQIRSKGTVESYEFIKNEINSKGQTPSVDELFSLLTSDLSDSQFARVFMLLALSSFLCPNTRGVCSCRYYPAIINVMSIRELDWCSLVLQWLISSIKKYQANKATNSGGAIGGCALLLVICYLEFLSTSELNLTNQLPRIAVWSTRMVKAFTLLDSNTVADDLKFGRLQLKHLCCTPFNDCFLQPSCCLPDDIQNFLSENLDFASEVMSHYYALFQNLQKSVSQASLPHVMECLHTVIRSLCSELSNKNRSMKRCINYLEDTDSDADEINDVKLRCIVRSKCSKVDPKLQEQMNMLKKYYLTLPIPHIDDPDPCPDLFLQIFHKLTLQPAQTVSDSISDFENDPLNFEKLLIPNSLSMDDVNNCQPNNELVKYLASLLQDSSISKVTSPEKHEDTAFIDHLIKSLEQTIPQPKHNYIVEEPVDETNQIAPLTSHPNLATSNSSRSKLYGLSLNDRLSIQTNLVPQPNLDGPFPSFDLISEAFDDDPNYKEDGILPHDLQEPDSLVHGLCKEFKKCSELLSEENRNRVNSKTTVRSGHRNPQVIFASPIENSLFKFLTTSISNSAISPKVFQYKGCWVDQRKISLSMMSGGWIHFHVMDCFLKMFTHYQESIIPFEGQIFHTFMLHSTALVLMKPLLDHKMYKAEFLEIVGFNIDKAGFIHIPCYITKQWLLIVVNFIDKRFDVLTSEFNTDELHSTINSVIYNFRVFFIRNFPNCSIFNIRDFPVSCVNVPKHKFRYDSGIFVLQFIQTFNGTNVQSFSNADLLALRARFLFQLLTFEQNESKSYVVENFLKNNAALSHMCPENIL